MRRFLLVQLGDIGDLALTLPAIKTLRAAYPQAHFALLAPPIPLQLITHQIDEKIEFRRAAFDGIKGLLNPSEWRAAVELALTLRRGAFDTIVYFHAFTTRTGALKYALIAAAAGSPRRVGLQNGNSFFLTDSVPDQGFSEHRLSAWARVVDRVLPAPVYPHPLTPSPSHAIEKGNETSAFLPSLNEDWRGAGGEEQYAGRTNLPRIALHAGSGVQNPARRWDADRFAAAADRLVRECGAEILLVGAKGDDTPAVAAAMREPYTDYFDKTTLPELVELLAGCDLVIGVDSGVTHLAAQAGASTLVLFGPSNPQTWQPPNSVIVRAAPECSPCNYVDHRLGAREGCTARTCMKQITVDQVVERAAAVLHGVTPPPVSITPKTPDAPGVERIRVLGLPISVITYDRWMALIDSWVNSTDGRLHHVCTVNPEMLMIARRDPVFRVVLERADLTVPDGIGLLWAAKQRGTPLPERVTGSDGVPRIAKEAAARGWRLFLLGAAPGIAENAAAILTEANPGLQIVGTYSGSPSPDEEAALVERVNASGADILLVAYGAPEQDKWIARNSPRLNVKMAMGIGGTLDFVAGVIPRAPVGWQRLGLEWLYRLILQPWRLKRMMRLPHFVLAVLSERSE